MRIILRQYLCAALSLAALVACSREPAAEQRETFAGAPVILISIDTLRADRLPLHGYRSGSTPHIDAFARDAVVYDRAYSHCPMTLPSHVSMLTGLLPPEHGVRNNLGFRYDAAKYVSLPQRLRRQGYATGAAVSSYVLRGETGMRDAFEWYEDSIDPQPGATFADYQRDGGASADAALKWLSSVGPRPFFFFLHLYEPHVPYAAPAYSYDGDVSAADAVLGRFLEALKASGVYDRAIIVLTSDHGEGLGDHGEQQHGILLYREVLHVPLIVKLPRATRAGQRVGEPVSHSDLVPMIDEWLGNAAPRLRAPIYGETLYPYVQLGWSDLRSVIDERFHYIEGPKPELYDVVADPRETRNVIGEQRRVASSMREQLAKLPRGATAPGAIDAEDAARLAALGYVGSAQTSADPRTLPNPRDHVGVVGEMQSAFRLANEQKYDEALVALQQIVARHPRLVDVWLRLAEVYIELGRPRDAVEAYGKAISASGGVSSDVALMAANVLLQTGELDAAANVTEVARRGNPDSARALDVRIALARKDLDRAGAIARELMDRKGDAESRMLLARVAHARADYAAALRILDTIGDQALYDVQALRADCLARLDRHEEAKRAYEKEIAAFPANRRAYSNLALLQFALGEREAAEKTLAKLVERNRSPAAAALAKRTRAAVRGG